MMNADNIAPGQAPAVINPNLMNGNSKMTTSSDNKKTAASNKSAKVTLDKNGKPKRKKASRGTFSLESETD
jgi:hypothetical protein